MVDGNIIRLKQDRFWLDVAAFDNNIRMGKKAMREGLIRQAIKCFQNAEDLYTGDYIENDLYNDFITTERVSLQNKHLNLLFNSMKMFLGENNYFKAMEKGKTVAIPCFYNRVIANMPRLLPLNLATKFSRVIQNNNRKNSSHIPVRNFTSIKLKI